MYKNLVIVGGGFAGTRAAQLLEHALPPDWILTLVSQENFITFNPLLPEVVGASIMPGHVVAPHRQMIHCSLACMATVTEIDTAARVIHYLGEGPGVIRYDQLVLACGNNANLDLVRGMAQYALPLKTIGDALFLRNRIVARLEQAELQPEAEHRRWLTSFIVVGGGFSGVETAGELTDFLYASLKYYKRISPEDLCIVLLHAGDRLLPELSQRLGEFTLRKLRGRGIDVRLGARAERVTDRDVRLESGEILSGGTVICTIGTQPNPLLEYIPAAKSRGRLVVNPDLSVPGVDGVWAAADGAIRRSAGAPARRQHRGTPRRQADQRLPLPPDGANVFRRTQQGGRRDLRAEAFRIHRLAHVARVVSAAHPDARAQDAPVPRVELGDVLPARHLPPRLPTHAAPHRARCGEQTGCGRAE
jgi:NADH dehydrogenase